MQSETRVGPTLHGIRFDAPPGPLWILGTERSITALLFGCDPVPPHRPEPTPLLLEAERQLREYWIGTRRRFTLPCAPAGTPFQRAVWREIAAIPYGETRTYGDIARAIGKPGASRAVGTATGTNPLPILVPCHRVLPATGGLGGFRGGAIWKRALLEREGRSQRD